MRSLTALRIWLARRLLPRGWDVGRDWVVRQTRTTYWSDPNDAGNIVYVEPHDVRYLSPQGEWRWASERNSGSAPTDLSIKEPGSK